MELQTKRLQSAGETFRRLVASPNDIASASMRQLEAWHRLLTFAERRLCQDDFKGRALHAEFFREHAERLSSGAEAEIALTVVRRALLTAIYERRAETLDELLDKARVWRRSIAEDYSKCSEGYPDEFLAWSIYRDIRMLRRTERRIARGLRGYRPERRLANSTTI
jgi:hypothetical protein